MPNALILNAYHPYPDTDGRLTSTLEKDASLVLKNKGYTIARTHPPEGWDCDQELIKHAYADLTILLAPVYWMGVSWSFQKYMDEVFTAGMDGAMSDGDGRSRRKPKAQYGMGGKLNGKYMIVMSFNAPQDSFNDPTMPFFQGISIDDLFLPMHKNFQFFGLTPLPSFAIFDVYKNPNIKTDLQRFTQHLDKHA